jgi:hypothetical protein
MGIGCLRGERGALTLVSLYYGFGKNDLWIYANNQVSNKGGKFIDEEKNG